MSSRRIPISSNQRPTQQSQQQQRTQAGDTTTPFRSSLDLVFSFSRSAGFFGENLPTGPSFVDQDRYRPQGYGGFDDDQDSSNEARGASHERDPTTSTNGEEDTDDHLEDEVDVTSSSQEELDQDHLNQPQQPRTGGEQLPRNAKGSFLQPRKQQQPHSILVANPSTSPPPQPQPQPSPSLTSSSLHAQFLPQPATERTPLLSQPSSLSDSTPHPHSHPQHGIIRGRKGSIGGTSSLGGGGGARQRRGSTFSRENWKAAIEEHRGESTWGQTLFNTYASILPSFPFLSLYFYFVLHSKLTRFTDDDDDDDIE